MVSEDGETFLTDSRPNWLACAEIVERGDPVRFAAAMAAPVAARAVLFPLFALNVEVARAAWVTEEAMIAEMRLQWWRDALEEMATQRDVRRHEVTIPVAEILSPDLAAMLDQAVAARRWEIYRDPFEDTAHFDAYLDQTAGHLMWVSVCCLGQGEEGPVRRLARAAGLAGFFKAIPALEAWGRVPLLDRRPEAVAALAQEALADLDLFRATQVSRAAWPALIPAFEARAILRQVVRDPLAVQDGRLALTGLRRSVALVRARRARF